MEFWNRLSSFKSRIKHSFPRSFILIRLSILMILLIFVTSSVLTIFFIRHQKEIFYQEKVASGRMILNHLSHKALLPFIEEDMIGLNSLMREAREIEGLVYAMVLDPHEVIKAHTDPAKIGMIQKGFERIESSNALDAITPWVYRLPSGERILNLSKPITFKNKNLGSVLVGLSINFIDKAIKKEALRIIQSVFWISLIIWIIGMGTIFFLSPYPSFFKKKQEETVFPEAVRKQVAVLYTGIREFKSYAMAKRPEEVFQDLSEYISIATKIILDYEGYIARVAGEKVVGIFQSSTLMRDHIQRAVQCAIALQKALEFNKKQGSRNLFLDQVGIGISSGVVLYGDIDSLIGKIDNYIGESFHTASSLYTLAGPGEIIISKEVYKSIENMVSVDPLPPREMTKRTEAWESFRIRHGGEREPHA